MAKLKGLWLASACRVTEIFAGAEPGMAVGRRTSVGTCATDRRLGGGVCLAVVA